MLHSRGDCSDPAAQRPGFQLAPHKPPADIHLGGVLVGFDQISATNLTSRIG